MENKNSCKYNPFVLCLSGKCGNCGWNPENHARRLEAARDRKAYDAKEQLKKLLQKCQEDEDKESAEALMWAIQQCQ